MPMIQLFFALSLLVNFGLILVDRILFFFSILSNISYRTILSSLTHLYIDIHFQYNGFLLGILLISISCMYQVSVQIEN